MVSTTVRIHAEPLRAFATAVFTRAGLPDADARTVADVLVWANLRGVDSHGVLRIPSYLDYMSSGRMNPRPSIRIQKETPAILSVDTDRAVGPVATVEVMRRVIDKAKAVGIGWAVMRNVTHQGALGYYALLAADAGMAGIVNTCGTPVMAPYGARAAGVHNSPIAISIPARKHRPLLLDMANSVAAGGKIKLASDSAMAIPPDWALDKSGNPTTDSARAAILLPIGGPKGSGIAMVFECLSSLMAENPVLSPVIRRMLAGAERDHAQNGIVAAIDVSAFTNPEAFRTHVDELIDAQKSLPTADGYSEVFVPGELGYRTHDERARDGIPLPPGTVEKLQTVAQTLEISFPAMGVSVRRGRGVSSG